MGSILLCTCKSIMEQFYLKDVDNIIWQLLLFIMILQVFQEYVIDYLLKFSKFFKLRLVELDWIENHTQSYFIEFNSPRIFVFDT